MQWISFLIILAVMIIIIYIHINLNIGLYILDDELTCFDKLEEFYLKFSHY